MYARITIFLIILNLLVKFGCCLMVV